MSEFCGVYVEVGDDEPTLVSKLIVDVSSWTDGPPQAIADWMREEALKIATAIGLTHEDSEVQEPDFDRDSCTVEVLLPDQGRMIRVVAYLP
jgi:hypothetical protein